MSLGGHNKVQKCYCFYLFMPNDLTTRLRRHIKILTSTKSTEHIQCLSECYLSSTTVDKNTTGEEKAAGDSQETFTWDIL